MQAVREESIGEGMEMHAPRKESQSAVLKQGDQKGRLAITYADRAHDRFR
jgi:hypothetical protein